MRYTWDTGNVTIGLITGHSHEQDLTRTGIKNGFSNLIIYVIVIVFIDRTCSLMFMTKVQTTNSTAYSHAVDTATAATDQK